MVTRVYTWVTDAASVLHFNTLLPYGALANDDQWECTWGGPPEPGWHERYDVIVGQRLADEQPLWREICGHPDIYTVYSIDDDLTNIDPENAFVYNIYHPIREKTMVNIAMADIVTVPTTAFAERMSQHNKNTYILPICIPDDMPFWPQTHSYINPVVGWSGSFFKGQDWSATGLADVLARYSRSFPNSRYHMIGADYTNGWLGGALRFSPWQEIMSSYRLYDFDIGLSPLMDSFFNALKSRTKLVEYGSRRIPAIVSAVGEYVDWVEHGVNGMLARNPDEWYQALEYLTEDSGARVAMGEKAYEKALDARISENIDKWKYAWTPR